MTHHGGPRRLSDVRPSSELPRSRSAQEQESLERTSRELCAVVLAAGAGARLQPLTEHRPKALCPVGNVSLLDRTLHRLARTGLTGPAMVAVNACHLADQITRHVAARARLSVERPRALGTSGAVARLSGWIDGRAVLVCNADAYLDGAPDLETGWSGETVRLLVTPTKPGAGEFGERHQWRFAGASLLPWRVVRGLPARTSELVLTAWRPAEANGELDLVPYHGVFIDCGTPADYLAANLHAITAATPQPPGAAEPSLVAADAEVTGTVAGSIVGTGATVTGGVAGSVVGAEARVAGQITRTVVWPGGYVAPDERLVEVIRAGRDLTVAAHP